jgi:hypothetical protein
VSTSTTALTTTFSSTTTTSSVCPPNATITIKVVDVQGNPIQGATVVLTPTASTSCLTGPVQGVTNSQGLVSFTVPALAYTVTVSKGGVSSSQTVTVSTAGQVFTITLNVTQGGMIPGFPLESILAGILLGVATLVVLRHRRR